MDYYLHTLDGLDKDRVVLADLQHIGDQVYEYCFYYDAQIYHGSCKIDYNKRDPKSRMNLDYINADLRSGDKRFGALHFQWMPARPIFVIKGAPKMKELKKRFIATYLTFPEPFKNDEQCHVHRRRQKTHYHCSYNNVLQMIKFYNK